MQGMRIVSEKVTDGLHYEVSFLDNDGFSILDEPTITSVSISILFNNKGILVLSISSYLPSCFRFPGQPRLNI